MKFKSSDLVWINGQPYAKDSPLAKRVYEDQAKNDAQPVGGLRNTERKPDSIPTLDNSKTTRSKSKRSMGPIIEVHIISFRRRNSDLDNIIAGAKPIRDSIAKSLGCDDGDVRIRWRYDTIITTGAVGTQVLVSKL